MKTIKLFTLLNMLGMLMFACTVIHYGNEDDDNNNSSSGGSNNLKAGQIEIKVYPDNNRVSFRATTGKITIDWGDGSIDKLTPNGVEQTFSHTYTNNNLHTIKIESERLEVFGKRAPDSGPGSGTLYTGFINGTFKELYFGEMNELQYLVCTRGGNSLTVLEIKKASALRDLYCPDNQLTSLDLRGCTTLNVLDCSGNKLKSLNVKGSTIHLFIDCSNNQLTSLDLRDLPTSFTIDCSRNQLTSLDLRGLTSPFTIDCSRNQLTSLDLRGCTGVYQLNLRNNQLTSLDVSGCTSLNILNCNENKLTSNALNSLFESLPNRPAKDGWIYFNGNPGTGECNELIARNKGWNADERDAYVGSYRVIETIAGAIFDEYLITITKSLVAPNDITIRNFFGVAGWSVYATVSGNSFIIPQQTYGMYGASGSGRRDGNTLYYSTRITQTGSGQFNTESRAVKQ